MPESPRRRYDSSQRRLAAAATRLQVVRAARELMLEHGFAGTTMAAVAARAGVAVQTLYTAAPGGKPGLARAVYDVTLAGDAAPVPQSGRPEVQAITAEPDPGRKVALFAAMAVGIWSRTGPVHRVLRAALAGPAGDDAVGALLAETEDQRLRGSRGLPEHLAALGLLREGLTVQRATHQVYALTAPELYDRLTVTCGWPDDEVGSWLTGVLTAALLDS